MKSMLVGFPHSILLCFAITVCATEHCEEEHSTFQLLQVSQALDVPAEHVEAQREDVAQGFFHAVGSAEAAAVLQPGLIAERTFEEVFVTSSRQQQPVALTQKSAEAAVGTETICIIVGAVLLAVLVCLIFCCFRPSVSYEEASGKEGQGSFIPAGAATLQRRPQNQDCC
mmetsp:Transcript_75425/g.104759  ORF Transcript_75425/g.104759 Transcript_75425/m.104759 type:complete len:170 (+) Transcript_75425:53-562(+)